MTRYLVASAAAALAMLVGNGAAALELQFPVACVPREDCHVQQYVDRDPGPGAADWTCGPLAYDGHKGTDIRLPDRAAMRRGVPVLAAADGVVSGIRDGMPDVAQGEPGAPDLAGRDCGNGVLLAHAGGWTTQYCHLREGSVAVGKGEEVEAGSVLGEIGLSGRTQFPHLHLVVRDPERRVIDPFDAREMNASCTFDDRETLWADPALAAYTGGGALSAGILERVPDYSEVKEGTVSPESLSASVPALVFWAHFYGLREGDVIASRLVAPDGAEIAADRHVMPRTRATQFRAVGRRARGDWSPGVWLGAAELLRDGEVVDRIEARVLLR